MKRIIAVVGALVFSGMVLASDYTDEANNAYLDDVQTTGLTPLSGITGITDLISNITGLTSEATEGLEKGCYENSPVYAMCQNIYSDIEAIRSALFGDHGEKYELVLNDKKMLSDYLEAHHAIIQNALLQLKTHIIHFSYHTIPCVNQWTGVSGLFGLLHVVPSVHTENTEIIKASYKIYDTYDELANFFRSIESFYSFIEQADCRVKSNDALINFMQEQIHFRADLVIGEFEKTYQAFEDLVHRMPQS